MKGQGILNPELAAGLAEIGHGDALVLADAGLAIPPAAKSIHLELTCGVPTMPQVLEAVMTELVVERAIVATEFAEWNPAVFAAVRRLLPAEPDSMPHQELAADMAARARLYVKTGECSAYASVVLVGGVSYFDEAVEQHRRLMEEVSAKPPRPPMASASPHCSAEVRRRAASPS